MIRPPGTAAAVHVPPMPSAGMRFRSDDLDEVRAEVRRRDGEHSRVVHGQGPLGFVRHALPGRRTILGWGAVRLAHTLRGAFPAGSVFVHLPVSGGHLYRLGARQHAVAPGTGIFLASGMEFTRRSEPGSIFAIGIVAEALELELRSRHPEGDDATITWALRSSAHALAAARTRQLGAAAQRLSAALQAGDATEPVDHREAELVSLLADIVLEGQAAVAMPGVAARRLAALEGWIDANLHQPITLGRLCHEAGVGARSLQMAFQARRGMSPLRFVLERRLSAAHRLLCDGRLRDDVTGIAHGLRFDHMGRFAAQYRQAFGELPSETFRRARR
jgi:AraC-like DNA-binding protein